MEVQNGCNGPVDSVRTEVHVHYVAILFGRCKATRELSWKTNSDNTNSCKRGAKENASELAPSASLVTPTLDKVGTSAAHADTSNVAS